MARQLSDCNVSHVAIAAPLIVCPQVPRFIHYRSVQRPASSEPDGTSPTYGERPAVGTVHNSDCI